MLRGGYRLKLHNLLEEEVIYTINKIIEDIGCTRSCDKCKLDIAALALNSLPPKYVVTEKGVVYGKIRNMNYQFNTDVTLAVTKAMDIVSKNPHHSE